MNENKFKVSERHRQNVLDILNAEGGKTTAELMEIFGHKKASMNERLFGMLERGEVTRTGFPYVYTALVAKTVSGYEISSSRGRKTPQVFVPGYVLHTISDEPAKSYPAQTSKSRPRGCTILEAGL